MTSRKAVALVAAVYLCLWRLAGGFLTAYWYHPAMTEREFAALDEYALVAKVLHQVDEVDSRLELLGLDLASPIVQLADAGVNPTAALSLAHAVRVLERPDEHRPGATVPLLENEKMGELMPLVKRLAGLNFPALALDLRSLAHTPPFGSGRWRPRTREDLAELRAAAGCPFLVFGINSAADAEIVVEAGLEGVVVSSTLGSHLGGPAAIEVLPEILDAVAGMTGVYVGAQVRTGVDVFRYLAAGAEAVVVESDRSIANLEAELHYAMRLTGCETLADIGYECIYAPLFGEL
jgi:isopentenyl diphosphate isomerase/L-lactate dehydrogenase-like FMN-dependent dehydrogenase